MQQDLIVRGVKYSKLVHPLDEHRYLKHASVDSSEALHLYSGNVVTDEQGQAEVVLPPYFDALNRDVRYQLTVVGQWAHAIVANEVADNRFTIASDKPGVKVSWQITAVRNDAYMHAYPWVVETARPDEWDKNMDDVIKDAREREQISRANLERRLAQIEEQRRQMERNQPPLPPPIPDLPPPDPDDR